MKDIILTIVTAFFPMVEHSDAVGYCPCEWVETNRLGNGWFMIVHRSQGPSYCDEETFLWFSGRTGSKFPKDEEKFPDHVRQINRVKYSWMDATYVTLRPADKHIREDMCWPGH